MTAAPIRDLTHHTSPIARTNYTLRRVLDATGIEHAESTLPTDTADQGSTARELFARFYDPGTEAFEHDGSSSARIASAIHSELDRLDVSELQRFTQLDPVASAAALCNVAEALADVEIDATDEDLDDEDRATLRAALAGAVRESIEEETEVAQAAGTLFGPEGGQLGRRDPESSHALRRALSSGDRLRRAIDLIGKFKRAMITARTRHVGSGQGEPFSVKPKRDIRSALPVELLRFADPRTRTLAFYKHQTAQTMCYERRSRAKQEKGPFTLMIDASGSMYGERWEEACTLGLAALMLAKEQGRKVNALVFNSCPNWLDVCFDSPASTLATLNELLSVSPSGGTDITRAFECVFSGCRSGDILLISDGRDDLFDGPLVEGLLDEMGADLAYMVIGHESAVEPSLRALASSFWVGSSLLSDNAADTLGATL